MKILTIAFVFISVLCFNAKAQEIRLIDYPFKKLNVLITTSQPQENPRLNGPCLFIKTLEEYYKIFPKRGITIKIGKEPEKPPINFSDKIVLGVIVQMELFENTPDYYFQVMQDIYTKDIHFFAHHFCSNTRRGKRTEQTWIAIPKPIGDYQVHFHLINFEIEQEIRIFNSSQ